MNNVSMAPEPKQVKRSYDATRRAEGQPEIKADAILTLAEELLPRLKSAEWHDRAKAAAGAARTGAQGPKVDIGARMRGMWR